MKSSYRISDWASAFDKLYAVPDAARRPEEIWVASMAHCSSIGEAIRKSDFVELMNYSARAFCWMVSLSVNWRKTDDLLFRCENSLCQCVYLKFPELCGHCTQAKCICDPAEIDAKKDKAGKYERLLEKWHRNNDQKAVDYTTADWLKIFREMYGGRIHLQSMETLGFHFLEEAGEEAMAIRELIQLRGVLNKPEIGIDREVLGKLVTIPGIADEYIRLGKGQQGGKPHYELASMKKDDIYARIVSAKMNFIVELADTFSFFCSILIKLGDVTIGVGEHFVADLDEALRNTYGDPEAGLVCPTCKKPSCECVFLPLLSASAGGTK